MHTIDKEDENNSESDLKDNVAEKYNSTEKEVAEENIVIGSKFGIIFSVSCFLWLHLNIFQVCPNEVQKCLNDVLNQYHGHKKRKTQFSNFLKLILKRAFFQEKRL